MITTIVAIGSVSPSRYADVRSSQIELGNNPRIARISASQFLLGFTLHRHGDEEYPKADWNALAESVNELVHNNEHIVEVIMANKIYRRWISEGSGESVFFFTDNIVKCCPGVGLHYISETGDKRTLLR